jgi:UDP-glucose 4-epimerase
MHALITGGAGFIGSHLADSLLSKGWQVSVIDNLVSGSMDNISHNILNKNYKFFHSDIRNGINTEIDDVNYVFHLAALADIVPSIDNPTEYFGVNVGGTQTILEGCRRFKRFRKIIYAASSSCYGIPTNYPTSERDEVCPMYPYALTKWMGEELVRHWGKVYKIDWISLRLFNVYGPRARTTGAYGAVMGIFLKQKIEGYPFTVVGDGSQSRDFSYVTDVVNAFICAAESDVRAEILNVGSGGSYEIRELVHLLGGPVKYIPSRPGEPKITYADIAKIESLLHWKPKVNLKSGVLEMLKNIEYWRSAPLWTEERIGRATASWFKYLSE